MGCQNTISQQTLENRNRDYKNNNTKNEPDSFNQEINKNIKYTNNNDSIAEMGQENYMNNGDKNSGDMKNNMNNNINYNNMDNNNMNDSIMNNNGNSNDMNNYMNYNNMDYCGMNNNMNNNMNYNNMNNNINNNNINYNMSNNMINNMNYNNINYNNMNNNINNYIPDYGDYDLNGDLDFYEGNFVPQTDAEIRAQQEKEIRELEKMEEEKENKLKEEQKIFNEINDKLNNEIEESKKIAKNLPKEPDDNDPNKCVILFRFPDGEKNVERKFLKTDKIELLYDFIKSLGREIFTEDKNHNFSLLQTFPYKLYDDIKENTLEQEGLFPNSMIQIREKE